MSLKTIELQLEKYFVTTWFRCGVAWCVRCVSIRSSNRLQTGIVNNFSLFVVVVTLRACNPIAFDFGDFKPLSTNTRNGGLCEHVSVCFINT